MSREPSSLTETENKKLNDQVKGWQDWFDSNEELFTKLFSSVDHLRKPKKTSKPEEKPEDYSEPIEKKETDKKRKRKLRFKK